MPPLFELLQFKNVTPHHHGNLRLPLLTLLSHPPQKTSTCQQDDCSSSYTGLLIVLTAACLGVEDAVAHAADEAGPWEVPGEVN